MSFNIIGTGRGLPRFVLTNEKLSLMLDTSDEWISTRTGIKNRFVSTDETLLQLANTASVMALKNAKIKAEKIDLIICSTIGGEYFTPSLSSLLQREIGAKCPAVDINAACSGFIFALDMAESYFKSGKAENILVVSAEMMTNYIDWQDRATAVLFGDGAGAVVLTKGDGLLGIKTTTVGDDKLLTITNNRGNSPFKEIKKDSNYLKMNGTEVFKFAVNSMLKDIEEVLSKANLDISKIKMVIPHQANLRIINYAKEKLNLKEGQIACKIEKYGNTSSASIPIILSELIENKEIEHGDVLVLSAFGGGLSTGACVIKY